MNSILLSQCFTLLLPKKDTCSPECMVLSCVLVLMVEVTQCCPVLSD